MTINWIQAAILGLFACLCSNSCMAGQAVGNYTIGRPLVGGLVCGIILGDLKLGIACGVAMQLVYIALVTPGGTVSADVRAISYIGIPLAMVAISTKGLDPLGGSAADLAKSVGTLVGTIGTVLFYSVAALNLVWQSFGWKDIKKGKLDHLYAINFGWPWISHLLFFLFANRDFNLFWGYGCYSNERCITYGWSCNENAFYCRWHASVCGNCNFVTSNC